MIACHVTDIDLPLSLPTLADASEIRLELEANELQAAVASTRTPTLVERARVGAARRLVHPPGLVPVNFFTLGIDLAASATRVHLFDDAGKSRMSSPGRAPPNFSLF